MLKDDQWSLGSDHAIKRKRIHIYPIVVAYKPKRNQSSYMGVTMWMKMAGISNIAFIWETL